MTVLKLKWESPLADPDLYRENRALYGIADPSGKTLLYIGKADGSTVRERFHAADKLRVFRDIEKHLGFFEHVPLVARIFSDAVLTRQRLADAESLLIQKLQPWANIQARRSRISRPGLEVWNGGRLWNWGRRFIDR